MADPKSRLAPLFRRSSTISSTRSSSSSTSNIFDDKRNKSRTSLRSRTRNPSLGSTAVYEEGEAPQLPAIPSVAESELTPGETEQTPDISLETQRPEPNKSGNPIVSVQAPTPDLLTATSGPEVAKQSTTHRDPTVAAAVAGAIAPSELKGAQTFRRSNQGAIADQRLHSSKPSPQCTETDYFGGTLTKMSFRKLWVKRAGASPTLVQITEEDLVDDVRDRILKKYGNSLGRSFDAPDVTLRIVPSDQSQPLRHPRPERTLGPEESMTNVLESYYPGGQAVENALIIDVPRRTPRHSPRPIPYYMQDSSRPMESGSDYFPVMPAAQPSPHLPADLSMPSGHAQSSHHIPLSKSIINTGHAPPLPSPGARNSRHGHRPRPGRTQTTSPTVLNGASGALAYDSQKPHLNGIPAAPPIPTPPLPTDVPHRTVTPPPRTSSPRPKAVHKVSRKPKPDTPKLPAGLLDGAVPPINVLIVEDNIINLKLLEAFMKRLKVRWHTAMNGREAVTKWRQGGFHLVLMDIQLPVMNGLDATKEIRRLERLNNIGIFSGSTPSTPNTINGAVGQDRNEEGEVEKVKEQDTLLNTGLFKSPVIIVALTASSLQSDRHEALAAGCNDFLTKPVSYIWLERKIMEWGCMQALIDFDGWRNWKDFSSGAAKPAKDTAAATGKGPSPATNNKLQRRDKRLSGATAMSIIDSASGTGSGSDGTGMDSGDGGIVAGA